MSHGECFHINCVLEFGPKSTQILNNPLGTTIYKDPSVTKHINYNWTLSTTKYPNIHLDHIKVIILSSYSNQSVVGSIVGWQQSTAICEDRVVGYYRGERDSLERAQMWAPHPFLFSFSFSFFFHCLTKYKI